MATAADSSSPYSPRFRRGGAHNIASPWSHVVRGEHEGLLAALSPTAAVAPPPEPFEQAPPKTAASGDPADAAGATPLPSDGADQGGSGGDASAPVRERRSAWSRPANGVVEAGAVMGAEAWPALSEATKAPPKSSSCDSLKGLSNGSVPAPPVRSAFLLFVCSWKFGVGLMLTFYALVFCFD